MLRRISTRRLMISIFAAVAAIAAVSAVTAVAVGDGPKPPARSLANAVHDSLAGGPVAGVSADVSFTNGLIASTGAGTSDSSGLPSASPLLSGASGRLWISSDGELRLELQGGAGDTEIVVSHDTAMLEDLATNTVYEVTLPKRSSSASSTSGSTGATGPTAASGDGVPTASSIQTALTKLMGAVNVGAATPTDIGGAPAYTVTISPKHPAGLLGEAVLGWDAQHGMPLDVAIYASGNTTPVLELRATSVSFGAVDPSVFAISPPPGAKVVRISPQGPPGTDSTGSGTAPGHLVAASGVAAVSAALPFTLDAPSTLGGLQRDNVALLDWNGERAAVSRYGQGLASVAVIEFQASVRDKQGGAGGLAGGGLLGSLPHVSLGSVSASELPTALGTVLEFTRAGVDYVVAGFVGPPAVQAVARGL
jgi:outer membrane lipoprotein-sorting protein